MRKIVASLHVTLDGFVAGKNGEMDWVRLDDELFDLVGSFTERSDTALYGRVTYQMMDAYWPAAGDQPNASKHDIEHSQWYNKVQKVVLSETMKGDTADKTVFIAGDIAGQITDFKNQSGGDIILFGSPTALHVLMENNLIDEYWLFVNPVILGSGIPLFAERMSRTALKPLAVKTFPCGVTGLNYNVER